MLYGILAVGLAVSMAMYFKYTNKGLAARVQCLERDLHNISDMMTQMAEVQIKTFQIHSAGMEGLEERIMELSIPSHDSSMPLERRHQVLALSRQGVPLEDIVKRLKAPVGEAEFILNLQKYMARESSRTLNENGQVGHHA